MREEQAVKRLRLMAVVAVFTLSKRHTPNGLEPTRFTISHNTNWPDPNNADDFNKRSVVE